MTRIAGTPAPSNAGADGVTNADVARVFREVAELLEVQGANPFRIRAYTNAARTIEELPDAVGTLVAADGKRLAALPGIGADLAGKVGEIVRTGRLRMLRELRRAAPPGAVALMSVPGVGPKRARMLAKALHVRSVEGLARAVRTHRVRELPGFGAQTEASLAQALAAHAGAEPRMLRAAAADYAEALVARLRAVPGVKRVEIAGSYRRARETVGDIDILVTGTDHPAVVSAFVEDPAVGRVLARGRTRAAVRLRSGLQVDLRILDESSYGAGLYYFTGSKAHNIAVRKMARDRGLKINEYGVYRGAKRIAGRTEEEVASAVGLGWIPPELREARGELEAASAGTLPHLIQLGDVRGDLQVHTTDSDGRDALEAMAEAAEALGYEYLAVTDHSPALAMVRGLDADGFRKQMRRINRLNARLRSLTILKGAEVDILADGTLDLDDATLAEFDIVLVALHSKLTLPPAAQTTRLVRALRHPLVDVLAHPTGRLINRRRGAQFDADEVFKVAASEGKMIEVNTQPERLDLDDVGARAAIAHGVTLTLGTDAHSTAELGFMRWGVDQARRGWAAKTDVLNTRPLAGVLDRLHRERSR